MMTTIIVIAVFLNIVNAVIDWYRIKKNIRIDHRINAGVYTVLCVVACLLFTNLWYVIPMLLIRPVVFDPLLNILRKLNPFHVSMTTTSVIDKWEVKLLGTNGFLHWIVWLGLTVLSIVLINIL